MQQFNKEEILVMSPEEVKFWYQMALEERTAEHMRKALLDMVEIQEAKEDNIIKLRGD